MDRTLGRNRRIAAFAVLAAGLAAAAGSPAPEAEAAPGPTPTDAEQAMIEILNRTRADPDGEAARFHIDLNEGLPAGTLTSEPREPLAVNFELIQAARDHNADLHAHFSDLPPDHRGSDGKDPTGRATAAGASFIGGVAENNSWTSQSSAAITATSVNALHTLLFKDFTATFEVVGRGHRKVMLNGTRDEVGVAVTGGKFGSRTAAICTQDFITSNRLHLLGVVFADDVTKNGAYTMGEGLGGVQIVVTNEGTQDQTTTTTWGSGGWQVEVVPGTYTIDVSGGGLPEAQQVTGVVVTDANVKRDFSIAKRVPVPPPPPTPLFDVVAGSAKLGKTGAWSLKVTKAKLRLGAVTLTDDQAAQIFVGADALTLFRPEDRGTATVKAVRDRATGEVKKLTVKDAAGNSFSLVVKSGAFKLTLKNADGVDPTDLAVALRVSTPLGTASSDVATKQIGKTGKSFKLLHTPGSILN